MLNCVPSCEKDHKKKFQTWSCPSKGQKQSALDVYVKNRTLCFHASHKPEVLVSLPFKTEKRAFTYLMLRSNGETCDWWFHSGDKWEMSFRPNKAITKPITKMADQQCPNAEVNSYPSPGSLPQILPVSFRAPFVKQNVFVLCVYHSRKD